jgi:uncharacterized peroxidase-related enzyme
MSRIALPTPESAPEASRPILKSVEAKLGIVPNLFKLAALSPAALTGLTGLGNALATTLDAKTRERIALAVAQVNGCHYCLSAHTYLGLNVAHIPEEEIALNRRGDSSDPKAAAAVRFAAKVARDRGHVADDDVAALRNAGFADSHIVEIVAVVAENFLTNFLNNVAGTEIDFPVVSLEPTEMAA